jgi:hypothetical protein
MVCLIARINYAVTPFENDVYVADHDDRWKTVDIWVDAPDLAGNLETNPRVVMNADEKPVVGMTNHVVGRVRNSGAADATNFEVELEILEPWGSGGTWHSLQVDTVAVLDGQVGNPAADYLIISDWVPTAGEHTCVRLHVRTVANDINPDNNRTQENITEFVASPGSPYQEVVSNFQVENPYREQLPILFRVDGLPPGWAADVNPPRPLVDPGDTVMAQVTIQPADAAPLCTREEITLSAYVPMIDTLQRLGAITLGISLKNGASVTLKSWTDCPCECPEQVDQRRPCFVYTRGCTDPAMPNTTVAVVYAAPDGKVHVHRVNTDRSGCFVDLIQADGAPGLWETKAVIEESDCGAPADSGVIVVDTSPQPDERCRELKAKLQELTKILENAIRAKRDDQVKAIYEQIRRILEREETCRDLAAQLEELYAALVDAYFSGAPGSEVESILRKIYELIQETSLYAQAAGAKSVRWYDNDNPTTNCSFGGMNCTLEKVGPPRSVRRGESPGPSGRRAG